MNNVIIKKEALKRVFGNRLTWFLMLMWTSFICVFLIFDITEHPAFNHWISKGFLNAFALLFGFAGIFFFKYNIRLYLGKIKNQNELLLHRESMLMKSNEKLIRQSKFLKLVTDSFSHPFFVVDAETYEIMIANKAFHEHHKLPENYPLSQKKCYELSHQYTHPCDGLNHPCPLQQAKTTGKSVTTRHVHKSAEGTERMVEVTAFPVIDEESGKVKQIIEYNVDITERINEQFILAEKEERLRTIITTSPDGIAVTDLQGYITFASEKSASLLGYDEPSELLGKNIYNFLHPNELQKAKDAAENLINNKHGFATLEFVTIKKDGTFFHQETNASLLFDKSNIPYSMVLITRDITERKRTEERLLNLNKQLKEKSFALEELNKSLEIRIKDEVEASREKDRMLALQSRQAAMGEMIGNIAHQWRQPLNTITLILFDLLEAYNHGELNEQYLQNSYTNVNGVVQTMSQTIDDFRNFFKPNKELKVFDVNKIIEQSLSFSEAGINANQIQVTFHYNGEIPVQGYPNELIQTLINIFQNAKDALINSLVPEKKIHVETRMDTDLAIIEVSNNGGTISEEHIEKVFDPYYSTKPEGQGTGLGLFISKTIIEKNMKGKLHVHNTPVGVCFHIELQAYKK
jgi:PAS domain S-box-containing protein